MNQGSQGPDPDQLQAMIQRAVQQSMASDSAASPSQSGQRKVRTARVSRQTSSGGGIDEEQIRQLVAQELKRVKEASGAGSAGEASSSGSTASSSGSQQIGWGGISAGGSSGSASGSASSSPSGSAKPSGSSPSGSSASVAGSTSSAQAVAEVLGQAQWQLSQDLSANLQELRRVINQSQEIARKIEQVLGQGTSGQSG